MYLKFSLILFLFYLITTYLIRASSSCGIYCDCGPPARPVGTSITIRNTSPSLPNQKIIYKNGSKVKYKCLDSANQLIGSETRSCRFGKWLGSTPSCAINIRNNTRLIFVSIIIPKLKAFLPRISTAQELYESGVYSVPFDMRPDHCIYWRVSGDQDWTFKINRPVNINYVKLTLYASNLYSLWSNDRISFQLKPSIFNCTLVNSTTRSNYLTLQFMCQSRRSLRVSTTIDFKVSTSFKTFRIALCDLRLYQSPYDCGFPDYTLSTVARNDAQNIYTFQCKDDNYLIEGSSYIECNSNGKWSKSTPVCVPKPHCKLFEDLNLNISGNLIINYEEINIAKNGDHVVSDGKLAYFSCNNSKSIKLNGMAQVVCRRGEWFGLSSLPFCALTNETIVQNNVQLKVTTDKFALITMGSLIGILSIPTILLIKRSMHKKQTVYNFDLNLYDDNDNMETEDHYYSQIDYWDIKSKSKSIEILKSQEEIKNNNHNDNNKSNFYVE